MNKIYLPFFILSLFSVPAQAQSEIDPGLRICKTVVAALDKNGDSLFEDADNAAAMAAAEQCIKNGSRAGLLSRAYMHRRLDNNNAARADIAAALKAGADRAAANRLLCALELDARNYSGALTLCDQAINTSPDWAMAYSTKSVILTSQGKHQEALPVIDKGLSFSANNVSLLTGKARALNQLNRNEEALVVANRLVTLAPQAREPHAVKGLIEYGLKRYQPAIQSLNIAIGKSPAAYEHWLRAESYYNLKNQQAALADYDRSIALDPKWAQAYRDRSWLYKDMNQAEKRLADLNKAIELDPKWATPYKDRGWYYKERKLLDQALADFNKAVELSPQWMDAVVDRGIVYQEMKQFDKALADYNHAIKLDPKSAKPWSNGASLGIDLRDYAAVIKFANEAILRDPANMPAYNNRAFAHYHLKNFDQALQDYNKSLSLNPTTQQSLFWRARTHTDLKNFPAAIADYTKLIEVNRNYAWAWVNRGVLYSQLKQYDKAYSDLNHILPRMKDRGYVWEQWVMAGVLGQSTPYPDLENRINALWSESSNSSGKYLARALVRMKGFLYWNDAGALSDLEAARALEPNNVILKEIDRLLNQKRANIAQSKKDEAERKAQFEAEMKEFEKMLKDFFDYCRGEGFGSLACNEAFN